MLPSEQEIHASYLRAIRQTLREVILPELASPAGRNAAALCDLVLVRMIAAREEFPALRSAHREAYLDCLAAARTLTGGAADADDARPLHEIAASLQAEVRLLFDGPAAGADPGQAATLLAKIAGTDAQFRDAYEAATKRTAAKVEPSPPSLRVTGEAVQAYLDRRFSKGSLRVTTCHQIPGGRSKLTVLLSVAPNRLVPADMVMRIDNPGSAIDTTVSDEFPVLAAMYRGGICAPEPLWVETDSTVFGAPFLVMRRMPGSAPGDLWDARGVSPSVGLALAEALARIHGADAAAIWPEAPARARDAVEAMLARFEGSWRQGRATPSIAMEGAFGWLRRHLSCIEGRTVPVHGDPHFANVLAEGDKLVCLLDWEFTHPGHPADDLAYCRGYVESIMEWSAFLDHYRAFGGLPVTEDQLRFFGLWGYLRNITFGANMLRDFVGGRIHGIQNLAIALNTRAKIEALLATSLAGTMRLPAATE